MISFSSRKGREQRNMHRGKVDFLPGPLSCDKLRPFLSPPLWFVSSFSLSDWQDTWLAVTSMCWLTEVSSSLRTAVLQNEQTGDQSFRYTCHVLSNMFYLWKRQQACYFILILPCRHQNISSCTGCMKPTVNSAAVRTFKSLLAHCLGFKACTFTEALAKLVTKIFCVLHCL